MEATGCVMFAFSCSLYGFGGEVIDWLVGWLIALRACERFVKVVEG